MSVQDRGRGGGAVRRRTPDLAGSIPPSVRGAHPTTDSHHVPGRQRGAGRTIRLIDLYQPCVVEGCWVWSLELTDLGMCPPHLWDHRHLDYMKDRA